MTRVRVVAALLLLALAAGCGASPESPAADGATATPSLDAASAKQRLEAAQKSLLDAPTGAFRQTWVGDASDFSEATGTFDIDTTELSQVRTAGTVATHVVIDGRRFLVGVSKTGQDPTCWRIAMQVAPGSLLPATFGVLAHSRIATPATDELGRVRVDVPLPPVASVAIADLADRLKVPADATVPASVEIVDDTFQSIEISMADFFSELLPLEPSPPREFWIEKGEINGSMLRIEYDTLGEPQELPEVPEDKIRRQGCPQG